jgi:hypothetical protein
MLSRQALAPYLVNQSGSLLYYYLLGSAGDEKTATNTKNTNGKQSERNGKPTRSKGKRWRPTWSTRAAPCSTTTFWAAQVSISCVPLCDMLFVWGEKNSQQVGTASFARMKANQQAEQHKTKECRRPTERLGLGLLSVFMSGVRRCMVCDG